MRYEFSLYNAYNNAPKETSGLGFAYRNLYKLKSVQKQLEFVQNYGIGLREKISVGGVLEVIWKSEISKDVSTSAPEILNKLDEYFRSREKHFENVFMYGGEESSFPASLESWTSSVATRPKILRTKI